MLLNFRDFGGVPTRSGGMVREGMLFRSGHMDGLAQAAQTSLLDHSFGLVIDLRYPEERRQRPSPWPLAMQDHILTHAAPDKAEAPHLEATRAAMRDGSDILNAYRQLYAALPFDRWYWPLFAQAVQRAADSDGPLLIHCTAGKDRTGLLVAILLRLLDVPDDAVIADYLRSASAPGMERLRDDLRQRVKAQGLPLTDAQVDQLCGVDRSYLEAAFAAIDERHGSLHAYLLAGGLPPPAVERLRARYLA